MSRYAISEKTFETLLADVAAGRKVYFKRYSFRRLNLDGRDLSGIWFTSSYFNGMSLRGTIFRGCQLQHTRFKGCDLTGADFTGAFMQDVDMEDTVREGTIFDGCNMREVRFAKIWMPVWQRRR